MRSLHNDGFYALTADISVGKTSWKVLAGCLVSICFGMRYWHLIVSVPSLTLQWSIDVHFRFRHETMGLLTKIKAFHKDMPFLYRSHTTHNTIQLHLLVGLYWRHLLDHTFCFVRWLVFVFRPTCRISARLRWRRLENVGWSVNRRRNCTFECRTNRYQHGQCAVTQCNGTYSNVRFNLESAPFCWASS